MENIKKQKISVLEKVCPFCQKKFFVKNTKKQKKFCSLNCVYSYRTLHKEEYYTAEWVMKVNTSKKRTQIENPEKWKRFSKLTSERMKKNNPSYNPLNIEKALKTKKQNGTLHIWKGERGGNGKLTEPQTLLQNILGDSWIMEYVVTTPKEKRQEMNYPNNYKIDIANPKLKIAIEIDGKAHQWRTTKQKDLKKTECLNLLGWKTLRFWNWDILENPEKIKKQIMSII